MTGSRRFYTAPGRELVAGAARRRRAPTTYQVDFTAGTGTQTRYERIAGIDVTDYYADWPERAGEAR